MRRFILAVMCSGLAYPALAQDVSTGMRLTVRPSGYEADQDENQQRQEKLLKRMEQSDHMIRSICINCGDVWKHQIYAPFDPYASLKPSARPSDEAAD
jgi:hypothetical protein